MKQEEILAMEPGIELDKLVAVQVMGWEIRQEDLPDHQSYREYYYRNGEKYENVDYPDHWQPSQYIDAAWEVMQKLIEDNECVTLDHQESWTCSIVRYFENDEHNVDVPDIEVSARTAPEAICKAALLAVLEDINLPGEETTE